MRLYVLDASAWLRMFLHDGPMPVGLESATAEVDAGNASFVAPELILVEAAHALHAKRSRRALADAEVTALWNDMQKTPMDLLSIADHTSRAMDLAQCMKLTVYDAMYLAVADHIGAPLFTADDALARAATAMNLVKS